jgi:hypothetical protein
MARMFSKNSIKGSFRQDVFFRWFDVKGNYFSYTSVFFITLPQSFFPFSSFLHQKNSILARL